MNWDKRKLGIGIGLVICTLLCIMGWISRGYTSYYLTGTILFTLLGAGFIRSARK